MPSLYHYYISEMTHTHTLSFSTTYFLDFWTTRCTRCPAALDVLNEYAARHPEVTFVSICCGVSSDIARQIIEQGKGKEVRGGNDEENRWNFVKHYFMETEDKEVAKQVLGFQQVPFYVVLNEDAQMVFKGNKLPYDVLFPPPETAAAAVAEAAQVETTTTSIETSMNVVAADKTAMMQETVSVSPTSVAAPAEQEQVFVLDDMDF